jgi:hypothetical protein
MNFASLDEVKAAFLSGQIEFPQDIQVAGVPYSHRGSSNYSLDDMLKNGKKGVVIYHTPQTNQEAAKQSGLNEWMLFVWSLNNRMSLVPAGVVPTTKARALTQTSETVEPEGEVQTEAMGQKGLNPSNVIGDTVTVRFATLGSKAVKGKVDTGAEMSSIHADSWDIRGDKVSFVSRSLSPNTLTLPLVTQQAVKSANGVQYRPVIELTVKINDRVMNGMQFNLSDRKHMDFPVLVGQNILEKGKFLIDPSLREEIDWEFVDAETKNVIVLETVQDDAPPSTENVQKIYNILKDNDVSFADLVRYIRTEVVQTMEDVKY